MGPPADPRATSGCNGLVKAQRPFARWFTVEVALPAIFWGALSHLTHGRFGASYMLAEVGAK